MPESKSLHLQDLVILLGMMLVHLLGRCDIILDVSAGMLPRLQPLEEDASGLVEHEQCPRHFDMFMVVTSLGLVSETASSSDR